MMIPRFLLIALWGLSLLLPVASGRASSVSRGQHYAVVIVLDGAPAGMLTPRSMPHLRWLMNRGVTYTRATAGQLLANTPPSHATIGTGVFPRRHGVMGFWWEDPRTGTVTRPTDTAAIQAGALEAVLQRHHVPSIAASVKSVYPHGRIVAVSGHKCYAADLMGTATADYILCSLIYHDRWVAQAVKRHMPPPGAVNNSHWDVPIPNPRSGFAPAVEQWRLGQENDWTTRYALWAFHRVHYPRVLMINLPETDVTGHFAPNPTAVARVLMARFDRALGRIIDAYRAAGILDQTDFVVTSDHGMMRVRSRLPFSVLDRAINLAGATKVYLEADTAAAIGIRESDKAHQVALDLALLAGSRVRATLYKSMEGGRWSYHFAAVRSEVSSAVRSAYLDLANTSAGPDGPDVLALYAPGVTTGDRPARGYHWVGAHLGASWAEQHIPLIIAGPGVRHGAMSTFPARLVDIAPTLEHLMGAPVGDVDGVVLADALQRTPAGMMKRQEARRAHLVRLVRALQSLSVR